MRNNGKGYRGIKNGCSAEIQSYMIPHSVQEVLKRGAQERFLPLNIHCPNRCLFCYESEFTAIVPWLKTRYIPQYTRETFNFFFQQAFGRSAGKSRTKLGAMSTCIQKINNAWHYFNQCDFFNTGLNHRQIERIIKNSGPGSYYTTGLNVDSEFIRYLVKRYPRQFFLHLSLITFDPVIRRKIMSPHIDIENIKKICAIAKNSVCFFLYFTKDQLLSDCTMLNAFSPENTWNVYVHRLYYNKNSPECLKEYSLRGEKELEAIIYYLKKNEMKLKHISKPVFFSPSSDIYAWFWRREIKKLLSICKNVSGEIIFCSEGASRIIREVAGEKISVVPIKNCMGGSVDFTFGMTIQAVIVKINRFLKEGIPVQQIYLPSSMFVEGNDFDLQGVRIGLLKKTFPGIKVVIISIPHQMSRSKIPLDICLKYFMQKSIPG